MSTESALSLMCNESADCGVPELCKSVALVAALERFMAHCSRLNHLKAAQALSVLRELCESPMRPAEPETIVQLPEAKPCPYPRSTIQPPS